MWGSINIFCTAAFLIGVSLGLNLIEISFNDDEIQVNKSQIIDDNEISNKPVYPPLAQSTTVKLNTPDEGAKINQLKGRRNAWGSGPYHMDILDRSSDPFLDNMLPDAVEDDKDDNLKLKIKSLVEQTIYDTNRKVKALDVIKENYTSLPSYRIGFILCMLQKEKHTVNELFNVAMRHRDDWKALEQLKVFEMVIHTSVDTTQLMRQVVDYHIQYINSSTPDGKMFLIK